VDAYPLEHEDVMKGFIKLTVVAMIGAAVGAIVIETTNAHAKFPARSAAGMTSAARGYADWQSAVSDSFGARLLARGVSSDTFSPNPFEGMDKMQRLPAPPSGYR
jgi:hypothetical protein